MQRLTPWQLSPPLFEVDARCKQDVSLLIQALLYSLDPYAAANPMRV
jgi:hypothetical protein